MFVLPAAGSECVPAGRVKVEPDCTLSQHPEVFVVGDLTLEHDLHLIEVLDRVLDKRILIDA